MRKRNIAKEQEQKESNQEDIAFSFLPPLLLHFLIFCLFLFLSLPSAAFLSSFSPSSSFFSIFLPSHYVLFSLLPFTLFFFSPPPIQAFTTDSFPVLGIFVTFPYKTRTNIRLFGTLYLQDISIFSTCLPPIFDPSHTQLLLSSASHPTVMAFRQIDSSSSGAQSTRTCKTLIGE